MAGAVRRWWDEFWTSLKESVFEPELSEADALVAPSLCRQSYCYPEESGSPFPGRSPADNSARAIGFHRRAENEDHVLLDGDLVVLEGVAGTVPYRVLVGLDSACSKEKAIASVRSIVSRVLAEVMKALDPFDVGSEVSKLCAFSESQTEAVSTSWVQVSRHLANAILAADFLFEKTAGLFDVARTGKRRFQEREEYRLLNPRCEQHDHGKREQGDDASFSQDEPSVKSLSWKQSFAVKCDGPDSSHDDDLTKAKEQQGLEQRVMIRKLAKDVTLDCCALTKGLFCSEVVKALRTGGHRNALCSWGGEVCASGKHPAGRPWTLDIPKSPPLATIYQEWREAEHEGRPMWAPSERSARCSDASSNSNPNSNSFVGKSWPSLRYVLQEAVDDSESLWHFASSGGWARPRKLGLSELVGAEGPLQLKIVPTVAVLLREPDEPTRAGCLYGAIADGVATAAAARGSLAGAQETLCSTLAAFGASTSDFRSWVFPAPAGEEPGGTGLVSGQALRDHVAEHTGRQLSLVVGLTQEGLYIGLNTTVLCASLEPPMVSFYLQRSSPLLAATASAHCSILSLRASDIEVAAWLERRGGAALIKWPASSSSNLPGAGESWLCRRRCSTLPSPGPLHLEDWPFFDLTAKQCGRGLYAVPAEEESSLGWIACKIHNRTCVGASLLMVCSLEAMSEQRPLGAGQLPLLRWNRRLTTTAS